MHNEYKRRVHSQNGLQLLLRGVLFGERRGSKVKGHSSFVNIRTGLPPSTIYTAPFLIMGISLLPLKTHAWKISTSRNFIATNVPSNRFYAHFSKEICFWWLKIYNGRNTMISSIVSYRYYSTKKETLHRRTRETRFCSFIITIHWFFIDISIYLTSFTFTL